MRKRFLCLWFPRWPVQRLIVKHPELSGQAIVVYRIDPRRGQLVAECSHMARQRGIQPGMPLAEAKMLTGNTEDPLHVYEHAPAVDQEAFQQLVCECDRFSPHVGVEPTEDFSIFADITGLEHLFGGEYQIAIQAQNHCRAQGYLASGSIADTMGQAWGVAHFGRAQLTPSMKPLIVPAGDDRILHQLPIEALRLSAMTNETLHHLGVSQVGQLLRLPRAELVARFGNEINDQIDKATGQLQETLTCSRTPAEYYAEKCFDYPTGNRSSIEAVLSRLVEQLCREMKSQQRGSLQWRFQLVCDTRQISEFCVGLFAPTAMANEVISLMKMQMDQHKLPAAVLEVSASVTRSALMEETQRELFANEAAIDRSTLNHLVNRLSSRLGNGNVVTPRLTSSKLPEHAYYWKPLVGSLNTRRRKVTSRHDPLDRPLTLCSSPVQLSAVSSQAKGSSLSTFRVRGKSYRVRHSWGPERIETRWWQGPTVRRDYFRVETDCGSQLWVFRDLRSRHWFLHGIYD